MKHQPPHCQFFRPFSMGTCTKGLRINVVSPTVLKESEAHIGPFFPGMIPVEGWKVGQAYKRAILGAQTGRVYKVD